VNSDHYYSREPKSVEKLGLVRAQLRGRQFEFLTSSSVFSHKRVDLGTRLLVESMILPREGCILDLGCGYGVVGIVASVLNPSLKVFLVDINRRAVQLAKENVKRVGVANIKICQGFLYEPVEGKEFDVVLSNPPISAGLLTVEQIVAGARKHLKLGGSLQLVVRSKISGNRLSKKLENVFGSVEVVARKSGYRVLLSKKP
jgi:16S rRNA (guanine1207-N2)-methyltransferase